MKQNKKKRHLKLTCLLLVCNVSVHADILTDGTVGDVFYLFGDNMIIPQSYGTTVGNNLFHSFAMFNIYSGEAVTFTGANHLENVIARVTGGDATTINGILSSNIGKANFYFINPAGVTFGKNAVVDVPAAFHVSTANQLNFADGSVYSATNPGVSTLTIAPPESFGFLGQTGDIVLDGAQIIAKPNQTIDLVANNITLKNNADIYAPAGEVRLVATKGSQNVSLVRDENNFLPMPTQMPNSENAGTILLDNSVIDSSGNGGGRVTVWGGDIIIKGTEDWYILKGTPHLYDGFYSSAILASNMGSLNTIGKGINIQASNLKIDGQYSYAGIFSDAWGNGDAGNIIVNVQNLTMNRGFIASDNEEGLGNAGDIQITAKQLKIDGYGGIFSEAWGYGNAGNITVNAGNLDILNTGFISNNNWNKLFSPSTSNLIVNAERLNIFNGGRITNLNGAYVTVNANQLKIEGLSYSNDFTGIFSESQLINNNGGNITVNAGSLEILNGGQISSSTFLNGNAGNVTVSANQLKIGGESYYNSTGIFSETWWTYGVNSGNGGAVIVNAASLDIFDGGQISSSTLSEGNAGNVTVNASQLKINGLSSNNFTGIFSMSYGDVQTAEHNFGNAGNVIINAGNLEIFNGGQISSSTYTQGDAGNVNVTANNINIDNGFISAAASEEASGKTGNITINSDNLNLFNGSQISVANNGSNDAGNILINTHSLNTENNSAISTFAQDGNGGSITINADNYLYLTDSSITTTTQGENSNGGDININSPVLIMDTGLIQANTENEVKSGRGGDINLNIQTLIPSYNSLIIGGSPILWEPYISGFNVIQAAAATGGVNGTINNSSPQFDISGSLSGLTTKSLDAPTMARSPCNMGRSTLKRKGKGGLPRNETKEMLFIPPATALPPPSSDAQNSESANPPPPQINQPCKGTAI